MISEKFEEIKKEDVLITFLKRTKDGEYARIDRDSLVYSRVKEQREPKYVPHKVGSNPKDLLTPDKVLKAVAEFLNE